MLDQEYNVVKIIETSGRARDMHFNADRTLLVPTKSTQRIQEMHTLMLHVISEMVDAWAAGEEPTA